MMVPELPEVLPWASDNSVMDLIRGEPTNLLIHDIPRPRPIPHPAVNFRTVRSGCWLASFKPNQSPLRAYDGTIRVEANAAGRTASGDLYQRPIVLIPPGSGRPTPVLRPPPNPAAGIPIQPLARYKYYLSITKILEAVTSGNTFELGFDRWEYSLPTPPGRAATWTNNGSFTADLSWVAAPPGFPSSRDYLSGNVKGSAGIIVGRLTLGWISPYYRKCSLEIDSVAGCEIPLDNGAGISWTSIFDDVGFDLSLVRSQTNVNEPSGTGWSDSELHAGMLRWRDSVALDTQWRYHLICVKEIDSTARGIMYDAGGTDSNKVAREGAAVAAKWVVPNAGWGDASGKVWGTVQKAYFRSAVHEIGHAMGLLHNLYNQYFMDTSNLIAQAGETSLPRFPHNIKWDFAENDLYRLRHWPDIFVRPGGVPFGTSPSPPTISPPDNAIDMPGVKLEATPLLSEVPLGAPVRIELELCNDAGNTTVQAPGNISLKSGYVQGVVTSPDGVARSFRSIFASVDQPLADLNPGNSVGASIVLMRGSEGALFPSSGLYHVDVFVSWPVGDAVAQVGASTSVLVTGTQNPNHAAAAHKVLTAPDAHLVLVFGGDYLPEGMEALQSAAKDSVLGPHYAAIEAKRLAMNFFDRKANISEADKVCKDEKTVMGSSEKSKLQRLSR